MQMPLLNQQENGCKFFLDLVLPNLCSLRLCAWFSPTFLVLHMPWHSSLEATAPGSNSNPVINFWGGIRPLLLLYKKKALKLINNFQGPSGSGSFDPAPFLLPDLSSLSPWPPQPRARPLRRKQLEIGGFVLRNCLWLWPFCWSGCCKGKSNTEGWVLFFHRMCAHTPFSNMFSIWHFKKLSPHWCFFKSRSVFHSLEGA